MSSPLPSEAPTLRITRLGIKNALSILSRKFHKEHLTIHQQQSTLLKLPLELRTIIWQYVLGEDIIRLVQKTTVTKWFGIYETYSLKWFATFQINDGPWCQDRRGPNLRHFAGLLRTCRLVQREAVGELYGCNRFIFEPASFWAASTKIVPHHFTRLRIIELLHRFLDDDRESWARLCRTIAGVINLHTLHMRLFYTYMLYHDDHETHRSGGLRHSPQISVGSPEEPDPISEEFILNSLYQIEQVKDFEVELDDRYRSSGFRVPLGRVPLGYSNAPFKLICEYSEDVEARKKKEQQEQPEPDLRTLIMAQRKADRLRYELEYKAQGIVQSHQYFSG